LARISSVEEAIMAPNDSQDPDIPDVEQLIIKLLPKVSKAVRRVYRHPTNQCEIEDITQDVLVLLMENDYHRLRSFDGLSKIETWMHTIVRHCVGQYLWKRRWEKENVSLDDLSPDALSYHPTQEKMLIDEDEYQAILSSLPERGKLLMQLALQGLKTEEIAKELGIKISSVYREKSIQYKKLRKLVEGQWIFRDGQLVKIP
jgi:RNA polymerase sigma factor (sigma-70 family)